MEGQTARRRSEVGVGKGTGEGMMSLSAMGYAKERWGGSVQHDFEKNCGYSANKDLGESRKTGRKNSCSLKKTSKKTEKETA